jgi:hypothetical protein
MEEEYHKKTKIIIYHCVLDKCVLYGILYGRNISCMLNGIYGGRISLKTKIMNYNYVLEKCVVCCILYGRNVVGMLNGRIS